MPKDPELYRIWKKQKQLPVILRRSKPPILIKLPDSNDNQSWLKDAHIRWPWWNTKLECWEVPQTWFDEVITRAARRWGAVYVIQLHREQQKCAPACWNAQGFHCECSCMGENHGSGKPDGKWYEVSDTLALQWGDKKYACRLITASGHPLKS